LKAGNAAVRDDDFLLRSRLSGKNRGNEENGTETLQDGRCHIAPSAQHHLSLFSQKSRSVKFS
jgi:hypothetical protein